MEDSHAVIVSTWEGTIEPDDLIRHLFPYEEVGYDEVPTAAQVEQLMRDYWKEWDKFPDEVEYFAICNRCDKLTVFDTEMNQWVHVVIEGCTRHIQAERIISAVRAGR